jgi:DivIVA domain-containing protein
MRDVLILLVLLAVAAVLFVAAVVATQEGDVLVDAPPDRPDVDLPAGHVVAEDLRSVRFGMVFRGYRMSEVDEVLERLGGELAERDERIADLERALVEVVEPAVQEAEERQSPAAVEETPEPGPTADEDEVTPLPEEWVAAAAAETGAPEPAPSPLDPGWEPSAVERTLDLVASYHLAVPPVPPPTVAPPAEEPEEAAAEPEAALTDVPEEELGFPEVEPAEPADRWAPEARDDTGDEDRGPGRTPEP